MAQAYSGEERRRPEMQALRNAVDHAQVLLLRLAALKPDDPARVQLAAELDSTQSRVLALRRRHHI